MNTLSVTTLLAQSLAWALLNSLWQGFLIYLALLVILKTLPDISSRLKYILSLSAMAMIFSWFADTWSRKYQDLKGMTVYITQTLADTGVSVTHPVTTFKGLPVSHSLFGTWMLRVEQSIPIILTLYALGLALMLARLTIDYLKMQDLKRNGIVLPEPSWLSFLAVAQSKFEINRSVKLYLSSSVNVPMMIGFLKPVILIPIATINKLTTEQAEAILLHELAHISRNDYVVNLLQTIGETILFFNPFVWLISSVIRKEREHCCDDMVVASSASRISYARALYLLEDHKQGLALTVAATGNKNQLLNRIKRIMEMKKETNSGLAIVFVAALMAIVLSTAFFVHSPAFAQKAAPKPGDTTKSKKSYSYQYSYIDSGSNKKVKNTSSVIVRDTDFDDDDDVNINIAIAGDSSARTITRSYSVTMPDSGFITKILKEIKSASKDASAAVADIDTKKIEKEIDNAKKEIDQIDWNKIKIEIDSALSEVGKANTRIQKDISVAVKKHLDDGKNLNGKADKTNATGDDYEAMLKSMEKDGLIDRNKKFKISSDKDNTLYINGVKQLASVYNKYAKYLKGKEVAISGSKGNLSISVDE